MISIDLSTPVNRGVFRTLQNREQLSGILAKKAKVLLDIFDQIQLIEIDEAINGELAAVKEVANGKIQVSPATGATYSVYRTNNTEYYDYFFNHLRVKVEKNDLIYLEFYPYLYHTSQEALKIAPVIKESEYKDSFKTISVVDNTIYMGDTPFKISRNLRTFNYKDGRLESYGRTDIPKILEENPGVQGYIVSSQSLQYLLRFFADDFLYQKNIGNFTNILIFKNAK